MIYSSIQYAFVVHIFVRLTTITITGVLALSLVTSFLSVDWCSHLVLFRLACPCHSFVLLYRLRIQRNNPVSDCPTLASSSRTCPEPLKADDDEDEEEDDAEDEPDD